jgi:hypothetical protein
MRSDHVRVPIPGDLGCERRAKSFLDTVARTFPQEVLEIIYGFAMRARAANKIGLKLFREVVLRRSLYPRGSIMRTTPWQDDARTRQLFIKNDHNERNSRGQFAIQDVPRTNPDFPFYPDGRMPLRAWRHVFVDPDRKVPYPDESALEFFRRVPR